MAAKSPVALILGAGPNIGTSVARGFASKGYKIALAARSVDAAASTDSQLNIPSDFTKPADIVNAFQKVTQTFGPPSVVVYNAATAAFTPADDPFTLQVEDLNRDMAVNATSPYIAAQQAVKGFAELPESAARTFIYTGNILNTQSLPRFISPGMSKSAGAHMIATAADAYKDRGYKFYYVDERKPDGTAKYKVDGDAHAEHFFKLSEDKTQGPWLQTFVKDVGYVKF
ncbi:putative short chain type dehydrogenase [Microdochium trichocladiopsis]|uniref:Short chain type dehydrogenase n=1 Tax=Microdochium trichocladiopsis TaxID=1682393 RepID=A0A9P8YHN6_9PEZI|nr:putative short chain type dehydrogenase [Microdochium trichocladiopsis]KAH7038340.1 putative short chain type dehydrogenase [Microdochium trichocladiopsis]